jgi:hypothetical protein
MIAGYLMRIPSDAVRQQICDTLKKFYNEPTTEQDVQGS